MNPRATTTLLLVTLLVVGGLYYLRKMAPATREADERRRYAAVFEPDDIAEIDIVRGTETVSLRRDATGWSIAAPLQDRADPGEVDRDGSRSGRAALASRPAGCGDTAPDRVRREHRFT